MTRKENRNMRGTVKKSIIFGLMGALALNIAACGGGSAKLSKDKPSVRLEKSQSSDKAKATKKSEQILTEGIARVLAAVM